MTDQLSITLEGILKKATADGIPVFHGCVAEADGTNVADWDRESGGDWKEFIACARAVGANILYVDKTVFEQSRIDDAIPPLVKIFPNSLTATPRHAAWWASYASFRRRLVLFVSSMLLS
jgi:hypothetical protein